MSAVAQLDFEVFVFAGKHCRAVDWNSSDRVNEKRNVPMIESASARTCDQLYHVVPELDIR